MSENTTTAPIEARIEKMVYGGEGLARVQGQVLLAPLVLPEELVEIQPVKDDPRLLRGRVTRIVETSPRRVPPACTYFAQCGGCHYQHALYEDQLRFKTEILVETLRRIGKLEAPEPQVLSGEPWAYRNRAQFKVVKRGRDFHLGYLEAGSNHLVDIEACPIVSPAINELLPTLRDVGRRQDFPDGTAEIEIVDGNGQVLVTVRSDERFPDTLVTALRERAPSLVSIARGDAQGGFFRLWGGGHVICPVGGFGYRVSHGVFFQVNRFLLDSLADAVVGDLSGSLALDLYSGAGYFTLPLARRFAKVEAVETNSAAVRDLRANCAAAKLDNVMSHRAATGEFLARYDGPAPDAILLDPPRAGLGQTSARHLAKLGARSIIYVSCDPPTLSRDLALLTAAGYKLEKLLMVDLFPQTFHIETVVALRIG
jgi:23S rRNA (uracil1939-C5)-methyltransferase